METGRVKLTLCVAVTSPTKMAPEEDEVTARDRRRRSRVEHGAPESDGLDRGLSPDLHP